MRQTHSLESDFGQSYIREAKPEKTRSLLARDRFVWRGLGLSTATKTTTSSTKKVLELYRLLKLY